MKGARPNKTSIFFCNNPWSRGSSVFPCCFSLDAWGRLELGLRWTNWGEVPWCGWDDTVTGFTTNAETPSLYRCISAGSTLVESPNIGMVARIIKFSIIDYQTSGPYQWLLYRRDGQPEACSNVANIEDEVIVCVCQVMAETLAVLIGFLQAIILGSKKHLCIRILFQSFHFLLYLSPWFCQPWVSFAVIEEAIEISFRLPLTVSLKFVWQLKHTKQ